jgi:hypothetical protein
LIRRVVRLAAGVRAACSKRNASVVSAVTTAFTRFRTNRPMPAFWLIAEV